MTSSFPIPDSYLQKHIRHQMVRCGTVDFS